MVVSKQHERVVPVINQLPLQRPKTLLQRLSSGIVQVLPSLRASSSRKDLTDRPTTAAGPSKELGEKILVSEPKTVASAASTQPCPYNPNSCHSFASIEKRRCSFCGMRGPKIVYNEPCHACKTVGSGSHITSDRRHLSTHRRHSAVDGRPLSHSADSSDSNLLGPRPVTPERAAKRIGNPPRVSKLPPGNVRLPASAVKNTQHHNLVERPPSRLDVRTPANEMHSAHAQSSHSRDSGTSSKKPVSPKLHHLHGLSDSEDFPFVHRHEIPRHAIALRAGSSSPLTDRSNSPRSFPHVRGSPDFSNTVYYGSRTSPLPPGRTTVQKPQVTTVVAKQIHSSGRATIDLHASPLDVALAESKVYKKRSLKQTSASLPQVLNNVIDSSTTFGSQDIGSTKTGGMRLELKGGNLSSTGTLRLRGVSGHERVSTNTLSYKLKRWILLCYGPCPQLDDDSDDDLPPPRSVTPDRVAKTRQKMNGTAPLPAHLCRGPSSIAFSSSLGQIRSGTDSLPPTTTFTTTISGPPKRNLSSRLSFFRRCSDSSANQPALVPARGLTPPLPKLRGGAEATDNVPPTLFWLTGGTGRKPISFGGWKQSRPKQRTGGLFGMAVFGRNHGKEYQVEVKVVRGVEVECSASVKAAGGDMVSKKGVQYGADVSSPSSSSLGVLSKSEPAQDVAEDQEQIKHAEPVQRVLTSPSAEPDDVPLCSGALPVDPTEPAVGVDAASSLFGDSSDKKSNDVVPMKEKARTPE